MARTTNRLTHRGAQALKSPGMHADGAGLYLRIDQTSGRSWVLIFHLAGRRREMGLGSIEEVPLAKAREMAASARALVRNGKDPIELRRAAKSPPVGQTFESVASLLLDDLEKGWKSPKQRPQWEASMKQHAPKIWAADVSTVDTEMVLATLQPIWTTIPETAQRLRGRIERVLSAARVRGLREGENPARWKDHLSALLTDVQRTKEHHPAMPYLEVPTFVKLLETRQSISALALRFLILTATRSGETRGARWSEISATTWVIPKERMKGKREHRIPITEAMRAVLDAIPKEAREGLIFPGLSGNPLSDATLAKVLRVNNQPSATPHGFRSSFRDWAGDCTSTARETMEEALAHRIGNQAEQAYRRSTALEKRRQLMEAWGDFCTGRENKIIQLHSGERA